MQSAPRTPFWLWPNVLSLDAPIVALVWQDFVARCYPSLLRPSGRCVLGLTVWAIYLADRLLDARHMAPSSSGGFYQRNWKALGLLLAMVLVADAVFTTVWLRPAVLWTGLPLGLAVTAYLGVFSYGGLVAFRWKRYAAALLFSAGVFLVALTGFPHRWSALMWPLLGFALLCLCNLLAIVRLEGRRSPETSIWLWIAALGLAAFLSGNLPWTLALASSALGLILLVWSGHALPQPTGRVLADAVLLTPILFR